MPTENQQLIANWKRPRSSALVRHCSWSKTSSELIAVAASDFTVTIINRSGIVINTIQLISNCQTIKWCRKSNILAVLPTDLAQLLFWNELQNCHFAVQLNVVKESLTWMAWSKCDLLLAIGTIKGNLILYDYVSKKFSTIYGKHLKAISCGCWNDENYLILGSEDCTVTVNSSDGKTLKTLLTKTGPVLLKTVPDASTLISLVIGSGGGGGGGRRAFFLYDLSIPNSPIEVTFRKSYGSIVGYRWCSRNVCLVLFANGQLVRLTYNSDGEQTIRESVEKIDSCPKIVSMAVTRRAEVPAMQKQQIRLAVFDGLVIRIQREFSELLLGTGANNWLQIAVDDCTRIKWNCTGQLLASVRKNGHLAIFALESKRQQVVCADSRLACLTTTTATATIVTFFQTGSRPILNSGDNRILKKYADLKVANDIYCFAFASNVLIAVGTSSGQQSKIYVFVLVHDSKTYELRREIQTKRKISDVQMNSKTVSFLIDGSLHVHQLYRLMVTSIDIEIGENQSLTDDCDGRVTCQSMDEANILYAASDNGLVRCYEIVDEQLQLLVEYLHEKAVLMIVPRPETVSVSCLFDSDGRLFVFEASPVSETHRLLPVPDFRSEQKSTVSSTRPIVMWQSQQQHGTATIVSNLFACFSELSLNVYAIIESVVKRVDLIVRMAAFTEMSQVPLLFCNRSVFVYDTKTETETMLRIEGVDKDGEAEFDFALRFGDYAKAVEMARRLSKQTDLWTRLVRHLIDGGQLSLAKAIAVNERLWSLRKLIDSLELDRECDFQAQLAVYDQDFELAGEWLRQANRPISIVRMKMRLQRWKSALRLAHDYGFESEALIISKRYAQQLQDEQRYEDALAVYKRNEHVFDAEIERGLLNCHLMLGDDEMAVSAASKSNDLQLIEWCADRLRERSRWQMAAKLYELCGRGTQQKLIGSLLALAETQPNEQIDVVRRLNELFDACDSETIRIEDGRRFAAYLQRIGDFDAAERRYRAANDFDSLVRLELTKRNDPDAAVRVLRETGSKSAARIAAELFADNGDFSAAVECLLLGDQFDEAFRMAGTHPHRLQVLGNIFEKFAIKNADRFETKQFDRLANVLLDAGRLEIAAIKYFKMARNWSSAFDCLLKTANSNSGKKRTSLFIDGFEIAQLANSSDMIDRLRNAVLSSVSISGEDDGDERKRLLLRLEMYRIRYSDDDVGGGGDVTTKPTKTATLLALELSESEQRNGNYKNAFSILVEYATAARLQPLDQRIDSVLVLLHSYLIGRLCIRRNEHKSAAELLLRIADQHLDCFPAHRTAIVASAVIECYRSDYRRDAVRLAQLLPRLESQQLDTKFRSKIEAIAATAASITPADQYYRDLTFLCPYCGCSQSRTVIVCTKCCQKLPICSLSGQILDLASVSYCEQCAVCFNPGALKTMAVDSSFECVFCSQSHDLNCNRSLDLSGLLKQPQCARTHFIFYSNSK